jgi:hypothetical protein
VTLGPDDEAPRPAIGPGFTDSVTLAFGDAREELYGLARIGRSEAGSTALAMLFAGQGAVAARAEPAPPAESFDAVQAAGLRTTTEAPLQAWTVHFDGGEAGGFELEARALSLGAELVENAPAAVLGRIGGYEHVCAVAGNVRVGGRQRRIRCLGQRTRRWGAPDWERLELTRAVGAWLGDELAVSLTAVRPDGARGQDEEALTAWVFEGDPPEVPIPVAEPRLSTTLDAEGRQLAAGLELWMGDEGHPRRAAGEARCGTTVELGRLRMDCAFFAWRMEGREGVGHYELLRRT